VTLTFNPGRFLILCGEEMEKKGEAKEMKVTNAVQNPAF
jgi:hypothetical protein